MRKKNKLLLDHIDFSVKKQKYTLKKIELF